MEKKEMYFNELFFLAEKENSLEISKAGFYRIFPDYEKLEEEMKKDSSLDFSNEAVIKISKEKFEELSAKFNSMRLKAFNILKELFSLIDESNSLIPGSSLRDLLEPCTVLYGISKNYKNFRFVTKAVEDAEGKDEKFHNEHVVPMNLFINNDFTYDEFDKLMKTKLVVCKVTDKENSLLSRDKLPEGMVLSSETPVWARYSQVNKESDTKIVVLDKYTGKEVNL